MFSPIINKLIKLFSKFPTVGPRTASRFVFYLMNSPKQEAEQLILAIKELKDKIKNCSLCQRAFEPELNNEQALCEICSNPKRNNGQICVVEKEIDLETLEKSKSFMGSYFILGENLSALKSNEKSLEEKLQILINRVKSDENIKEIILALNTTPEGQNTSLWIKRRFEPLQQVKITQLGIGLPSGAELEYADETTISSALEARR